MREGVRNPTFYGHVRKGGGGQPLSVNKGVEKVGFSFCFFLVKGRRMLEKLTTSKMSKSVQVCKK